MRETPGDHDAGQNTRPAHRVHGSKDGAAFQVIVLGSTGGPREDNVTGLLVRAPQTEWRKGSVIAVDAGAHLASIVRILGHDMPSTSEKIPPLDYRAVLAEGPFAGIAFPHISAKANALHVFRELLHSFLITHAHLDHLSGMAINTPGLEYGREAKAIVALPSTIEAIKGHIFNDIIWPNLSDEGHGAGFVTYRRLIEGGNPRLGYGEARGYVNVCDGLATKSWSISHGKCHRRSHSISHQRGESMGWNGNDYNFSGRRMSRMSDDHGYFAAMAQQQGHNAGAYAPNAPAQMGMPPGPVTPGVVPQSASALDTAHMFEPVPSSAFFVRNDSTGNELLIFGDVEPDSVSLSPRNHIVWDDAAPKIANGTLKAIFIECSYDDSVRDADLYGHLCPRHLIAELTFLAKCVMNVRKHQPGGTSEQVDHTEAVIEPDSPVFHQPPQVNMRQPPSQAEMKRKRKRAVNGDLTTTPELRPTTTFQSPPSPHAIHSPYVGTRSASASRRKTSHGPTGIEPHLLGERPATPSRGRQVQFQSLPHSLSIPSQDGPATTSSILPAHHASVQAQMQTPAHREKFDDPLKGLTVHIIHVKDTLADGPSPGDVILGQLRSLAVETGLGVEFNITHWGMSIWV